MDIQEAKELAAGVRLAAQRRRRHEFSAGAALESWNKAVKLAEWVLTEKLIASDDVKAHPVAITINQKGCARCNGAGHDELEFFQLKRPVVRKGEVVATHWAICPTTGEPIMMVFLVESTRR